MEMQGKIENPVRQDSFSYINLCLGRGEGYARFVVVMPPEELEQVVYTREKRSPKISLGFP